MKTSILTGEYFDAWWDHHKVWIAKKEIFSPELNEANKRVADTGGLLRAAFDPWLSLLPQPVNCTRDEYIKKISSLKKAT